MRCEGNGFSDRHEPVHAANEAQVVPARCRPADERHALRHHTDFTFPSSEVADEVPARISCGALPWIDKAALDDGGFPAVGSESRKD